MGQFVFGRDKAALQPAATQDIIAQRQEYLVVERDFVPAIGLDDALLFTVPSKSHTGMWV
jgi:hypothetical protein